LYTWKFKNEGRHNGPHLLILYLSFYIMFFTGQQVIPGCPFFMVSILISVEMTLIIRYVLQIDFAIQAKRLIEI
jgi:hypothetical protein